MQRLLVKALHKELTLVKENLISKYELEGHDLAQVFEAVETRLAGSIQDIVGNSDKKVSDCKNQLKAKNKAFNDLSAKLQSKESAWNRQRDEMSKQIQRNKKKNENMLKVLESRAKEESTKIAHKVCSDFQTQCSIESQELEDLINGYKKQNISLSNELFKASELIRQKDQDIEASNLLIEELMQEIEVNVSERDTRRSAYSQSDRDSSIRDFSSDDSGSEMEEAQLQCFDEQRADQEVSLQQQQFPAYQVLPIPPEVVEDSCGAQTPGETDQDLSTVDGSCATDKDFALPEWLEFDEPTPKVEQQSIDNEEDFESKTWPELLWDRFCSWRLSQVELEQ